MKSSKLATLSFALVSSLLLGACDPWEDVPPPALGTGECEYKYSSFGTETEAKTYMNYVVKTVEDTSIGGVALTVKRAETFPLSKHKRKDKYEGWGMHVVFTCGDADIKYEHENGYNTDAKAREELKERIAQLDLVPGAKVVDRWVSYNTYCSTCSYTDSNGNTQTYDCYCDDDYFYKLTYILVKKGKESTSGRVADAFGQIQSTIESIPALEGRVGIRDSIAVAHKIIPMSDANAQVAKDWVKLLDRLEKPVAKHGSKRLKQ